MGTRSAKRIKPLAIRKVQFTGMWSDTLRRLHSSAIPEQYEQLRKKGFLSAWRKAAKGGNGQDPPHIHSDSLTAHWLSAAGNILTTLEDKALQKNIERLCRQIRKAQTKDGYLNTHYLCSKKKKRWSNLRDDCELYGAASLIEAAITLQASLGDDTLIEAAAQYADHIDDVFGKSGNRLRGYGGHPGIERALASLSDHLKEPRYGKLAEHFIHQRGNNPGFFIKEARKRGEDIPDGFNPANYLTHAHLLDMEKAEGSARKALDLFSGAASVATISADEKLLSACNRMWRSIVDHKVYLTGAVATEPGQESFVDDYHINYQTGRPNNGVTHAMLRFARTMLQTTGQSQYANFIETSLYNNLLASISLDGTRYFECVPMNAQKSCRTGEAVHREARTPWSHHTRASAEITATISELGAFGFAQSRKAAYIHLFLPGRIDFELPAGSLHLQIDTEYPWDGSVRITVMGAPSDPVKLMIRIPGWCKRWNTRINARPVYEEPRLKQGYLETVRTWKRGETLELYFAMPPQRIYAHPSVADCAGKVAIRRGPMLYCVEEADNGPHIHDLALPRSAQLTVHDGPADLHAPAIIQTTALKSKLRPWKGSLYRPVGHARAKTTLTAIPFGLWANRTPGEMTIWMQDTDAPASPP